VKNMVKGKEPKVTISARRTSLTQRGNSEVSKPVVGFISLVPEEVWEKAGKYQTERPKLRAKTQILNCFTGTAPQRAAFLSG
jgi:hypothetical protein